MIVLGTPTFQMMSWKRVYGLYEEIITWLGIKYDHTQTRLM